MHKYSCDSDRRDAVHFVSLAVCAIVTFALVYCIDCALGGINIIIDFLLFLVPFGPFLFWISFANGLSPSLLRLSGIRDCSGKYEGELKTNYDEFKKNHQVTLIIYHKFLEMEIELITETSKSYSKTASLRQDGKRTEIVYTYENQGSIEKGLNSHIGTCIITIDGDSLEGKYYTHPERKSYGSIVAKKSY